MYNSRSASVLTLMKSIYPDSGRHVVGADFSEVSSHHAVVQPVEQHDHAHVHRVLRSDPVQSKLFHIELYFIFLTSV